MSKQKKAEAAILGALDGLAFDIDIDVDSYPDADPIEILTEIRPAAAAAAATPYNNIKKPEKSIGELMYISVDQCKPWKFANRPELEMGDIDELARSIKEDGQTVPALARRCKDEANGIKYEIIYGHRRWRACKLCDIDLFAIILDISDKDAAKEQKKENEKRKDLSEYSEAFSYKQMLDEKMFLSQIELAASLGIPSQTLSNLLSYTKIPVDVLKAMKTPHLLPQRTAIKIAQLVNVMSDQEKQKLCELSPFIINKSISFSDISIELFRKNLELNDNITPESNTYKRKIVTNKNKVKLFTSGLNHNKAPSITFHKFVTDNNLYDEVVSLVSDYLTKKSEGEL
tara:strand:+ start:1544 stop:2572 length:1029 start_codon:yes stop_codon:yes gene_type:complete